MQAWRCGIAPAPTQRSSFKLGGQAIHSQLEQDAASALRMLAGTPLHNRPFDRVGDAVRSRQDATPTVMAAAFPRKRPRSRRRGAAARPHADPPSFGTDGSPASGVSTASVVGFGPDVAASTARSLSANSGLIGARGFGGRRSSRTDAPTPE
jgi:hypothetical protein